jgi:hypothetical protein
MTGYRAALIASRGPGAAFVAMGTVWGAFMAAMPDLKAALGVEDGAFGLLLIWGSVAAIAMMTLAPRIAAGLGRVALPLFTVLMGAALLTQSQTAAPLGFTLALAAMGAATGTLDVVMNARVSAIEAATGLRLMNLNHALYSLGFAGAAALTGLARAQGLAPATILALAAGWAMALALLSAERDGAVEGMMPGRDGAGRAGVGAVAWLGGGLILVGLMAENAIEAWSALFVERDLGATLGAGSLGPALLGATMGIGRLAGQTLSYRIADRRMLGGGLVLALAGVAVVIASPSPLTAYAGFALMGLGGSVVVPTTLAIVGRLAAPGARSRSIARATMLGYIGYFIGPPLLGLIADLAGLRAGFALIAAALLAGLGLAAMLARRGA